MLGKPAAFLGEEWRVGMHVYDGCVFLGSQQVCQEEQLLHVRMICCSRPLRGTSSSFEQLVLQAHVLSRDERRAVSSLPTEGSSLILNDNFPLVSAVERYRAIDFTLQA